MKILFQVTSNFKHMNLKKRCVLKPQEKTETSLFLSRYLSRLEPISRLSLTSVIQKVCGSEFQTPVRNITSKIIKR